MSCQIIEIDIEDLKRLVVLVRSLNVAAKYMAILLFLLGREIQRLEKRVQKLVNEADKNENSNTNGLNGSKAQEQEGVSDNSKNSDQSKTNETTSEPLNEPLNNEDKKGHGRNGSNAYKNIIKMLHVLTTIGSICPKCLKGIIKKTTSRYVVKVVGQPIFQPQQHEVEQGRCNVCGTIFSALSEFALMTGIGKSVVYDYSAIAMLLVMHYFEGMPFKRLETLHKNWGIPFADANQWEVVSIAIHQYLAPLVNYLEKYACMNMTSFAIDDTGTRIISLKSQINKQLEEAKKQGLSTKNIRTGINATCMHITTPEGTIDLYFSGLHHAGEIVDALLRSRTIEQDRVIKITDGASKNFDHNQSDKLIECLCNAHAFLKFAAIKKNHPEFYAVVGEAYDKIFENDEKTENLSPAERLDYHKSHSSLWMGKIHSACKNKIDSHSVEPNSDLWEPVFFFINNWDMLTKFLNTPGIPLHTNTVEQKLTKIERYLVNSFNYKTINGAEVGDSSMSLISTAIAAGKEPVAYLTYCLKNHLDLKLHPDKYLPWKVSLNDSDTPGFKSNTT